MNKKLIKLYDRKVKEEMDALVRLWKQYKAEATIDNEDSWKLARNIELQAKLLGVLGSKLKEAWKSEEES